MLQRVGMGNVIENFRSRHESNLSKGSKIIRKSRTYKKYNRGPQHVKRYNLKGANVNVLCGDKNCLANKCLKRKNKDFRYRNGINLTKGL